MPPLVAPQVRGKIFPYCRGLPPTLRGGEKLSLAIGGSGLVFGGQLVFENRGPLWTAVDRRGPLWTAVDRRGPLWTVVDRRGPSWTAVDRCGPLWTVVDRRSRMIAPESFPAGSRGRASCAAESLASFPRETLPVAQQKASRGFPARLSSCPEF